MNYNIFEMLKNGSNPQQVVMTMLQGPHRWVLIY